jgi:hypothetical protein
MPHANEVHTQIHKPEMGGVASVEVTDMSTEAENIRVTTTKRSMGGTATGGFIDQAISVTPVEVEPHECEGGAAVCGHRGFSLVTIGTPSPEVVVNVPFSGSVDEQEQ